MNHNPGCLALYHPPIILITRSLPLLLLLPLPPALEVAHCCHRARSVGGKRLPHRSLRYLSAHLSSPVSPGFQGTSGVGWPPRRVAWWLQCALTVRELPRDWIRIKSSSRFEQISAVIFCVSVWSHSWWFSQPQQLPRTARWDVSEDLRPHDITYSDGCQKKAKKNNCVFEPAGDKGCTFFCARGGFLLPQSEDLRVNLRLLIARRCEYDWLSISTCQQAPATLETSGYNWQMDSCLSLNTVIRL